MKEIDIPTDAQIFAAQRTDRFLRRMQIFEGSVFSAPDSSRIVKVDGVDIPFGDAITVGQAKILKKRVALSLALDGIDSDLDQEDYGRLVRGEFGTPPPRFDAPDICPDGHSMNPRFAQKKKEILYYRCLACGHTKWNKQL